MFSREMRFQWAKLFLAAAVSFVLTVVQNRLPRRTRSNTKEIAEVGLYASARMRDNRDDDNLQSALPQIWRQKHRFPIECRFRSAMRTFMPKSCSVLRSWTVLPSGL